LQLHLATLALPSAQVGVQAVPAALPLLLVALLLIIGCVALVLALALL
jgi:hypothetical protein